MSDTRDARGAPRPPANAPKAPAVVANRPPQPTRPGGVRAPAPSVVVEPPPSPPPPEVAAAAAPAPIAPPSRVASEPPESGWDGWAEAERLPSSAVIPAAADGAVPPPVPARQIPPVAERTSERGRVATPSDSEPEVAKARAPQASSPDIPPMRRARSSPDLPPLVQTMQMPAVMVPAPVPEPAPTPPPTPAPTPAPTPSPAPARIAAKPSVVAAPRAPAAAAAPPPELTPTPNPAAAVESLPHEVQEQLFGILRAALDQTMQPLREKQRELETKLQWLNQENERLKAAAPAAAAPTALGAVVKAPSVVPPPVSPVRASMASVDITAGVNVDPAPKPSLVVQTSYGLTLVPQTVKRPEIEVALENVGPVDVTEFSRGRVSAGAVLVALLLAGVAAAIAAMALSYT